MITPFVRDVDVLSSKELMAYVVKECGLIEIDEMDSLLERARLAAVSSLTVAQLRSTIGLGGLSDKDCYSKELLRERAKDAVKRIRVSKKIPDTATALEKIEKRHGWRKYDVKFPKDKLGIALGLSDGILITDVTRRDIPALQPGDQLVAINDCPFSPCADGDEFKFAVLDRIRDAPRPVVMTFACGDARWPPELASNHELAVKRRYDRGDAPPEQPKTVPPPVPSATSAPPPVPSATSAPPPPRPKLVATMSIKELRATIVAGGLSHDGVLEKAELRALATKALKKIADDDKPPEDSWADFIKAQQGKPTDDAADDKPPTEQADDLPPEEALDDPEPDVPDYAEEFHVPEYSEEFDYRAPGAPEDHVYAEEPVDEPLPATTSPEKAAEWATFVAAQQENVVQEQNDGRRRPPPPPPKKDKPPPPADVPAENIFAAIRQHKQGSLRPAADDKVPPATTTPETHSRPSGSTSELGTELEAALANMRGFVADDAEDDDTAAWDDDHSATPAPAATFGRAKVTHTTEL